MGELDRFIQDLNLSLVDLDQQYSVHADSQPYYFVIGAPRAGTTLLTQVIAFCYQFGYITNIAARFYMAPVVGCKLSDHILQGTQERIRFWSRYASTGTSGDIHEFGWFWQHHLGMKDASDIPDGLSTMYFNVLRKDLLSLSHHFKRPIVMKGIYPAYIKPIIDNILDHKAVWVNIERNPLDCCESIYRACQYQDLEWFGWYPPKSYYDKMAKLSLRERIAAQVVYFCQYNASIADVTVQYDELCRNPQNALREIGEFTLPPPPNALYYSEYFDHQLQGWREVYDRAKADFSYAPT